MESEGSPPYSQESSIGFVMGQMNPVRTLIYFYKHLKISIYIYVSHMVSSFQVSQLKCIGEAWSSDLYYVFRGSPEYLQ
jgi:hypothetical protein